MKICLFRYIQLTIIWPFGRFSNRLWNITATDSSGNSSSLESWRDISLSDGVSPSSAHDFDCFGAFCFRQLLSTSLTFLAHFAFGNLMLCQIRLLARLLLPLFSKAPFRTPLWSLWLESEPCWPSHLKETYQFSKTSRSRHFAPKPAGANNSQMDPNIHDSALGAQMRQVHTMTLEARNREPLKHPTA